MTAPHALRRSFVFVWILQTTTRARHDWNSSRDCQNSEPSVFLLRFSLSLNLYIPEQSDGPSHQVEGRALSKVDKKGSLEGQSKAKFIECLAVPSSVR